mgnify:CR=1 FL=1
MLDCIKRCDTSYASSHVKRRKLSWLHSAGHCTVVSHFQSGSYEFDLPTMHTCVLLQFNSLGKDQSLSIRQVASNLKIGSIKQVVQIFQKLASKESKLIRVKRSGESRGVDTEFVVNEHYYRARTYNDNNVFEC